MPDKRQAAMAELNKALTIIDGICAEWNKIKDERSGHGGWMFDYKLYDLSYKCEDEDDFNFAAKIIFEEWQEAVRIAVGYVPETWDYNKYFEHDKHHGSYFSFREDIDGEGSLDFWACDIGLEWDSAQGDDWYFTPFEKAIHEYYNVTRFSTDRLNPDDYSPEEIQDISKNLIDNVVPALRITLEERKAVIGSYDNLKARQCDYICEMEGVCL